MLIGCVPKDDPDLQLRRRCFVPNADGSGFDRLDWMTGCTSAELIEKDGFTYQKGGSADPDACHPSSSAFVIPFEVGLVVNFTVGEENIPRGCGPLDGSWREWNGKPLDYPGIIYPGSPGYEGAPPCGFNTYAPEGDGSADIVAMFADDHDLWQKTFFDAWEKMQINGYDMTSLTEAPSNGQLLAPFMA